MNPTRSKNFSAVVTALNALFTEIGIAPIFRPGNGNSVEWMHDGVLITLKDATTEVSGPTITFSREGSCMSPDRWLRPIILICSKYHLLSVQLNFIPVVECKGVSVNVAGATPGWLIFSGLFSV